MAGSLIGGMDLLQHGLSSAVSHGAGHAASHGSHTLGEVFNHSLEHAGYDIGGDKFVHKSTHDYKDFKKAA